LPDDEKASTGDRRDRREDGAATGYGAALLDVVAVTRSDIWSEAPRMATVRWTRSRRASTNSAEPLISSISSGQASGEPGWVKGSIACAPIQAIPPPMNRSRKQKGRFSRPFLNA
jgi:hypothetical protein